MSTIDLQALQQTFIEESIEGLELMETNILNINLDEPDDEEINTIFRAIHSIKGGAATFGLPEITGLTNSFENLLDKVRNKEISLTSKISDMLLQCIDLLNSTFSSYENSEDINLQEIESVTNNLNLLYNSEPNKNQTNIKSGDIFDRIEILFKPDAKTLFRGLEPLKILREIKQLGDASIKLDTNSIPDINSDLTNINLQWELSITGNVNLEELNVILDWVRYDYPILEIRTFKNNTPKVKKERKNNNSTIRVDTAKLDILVNLVGELVITQSMLERIDEHGNSSAEELKDTLTILNSQMRDLQEEIISVRMIPIARSFSRIPRLVRDTSKELNKKTELVIKGESTEVDKTVSELITDPLVHIIRNSIDHGIEPPDTRILNNKPETGIISISAYHRSGNLFIEIFDDGGGLDSALIRDKAIEKGLIAKTDSLTEEEIQNLIFAPGFSTSENVSDVSGRGVGMDVVRENIANLKGTIELTSEIGKGTTFKIKLPLTLAILEGQLARVGDQVFVIPILSILETIRLNKSQIKTVAGKSTLYKLRDAYIPIINLYDKLDIKSDSNSEDDLLVIVESANQKAALQISDLKNQQQVVVKSFESNFKKSPYFSGATILGDGTVSLILDISEIIFESENLT